ncbi:hypothetical protein CcI49_30115 [Frankia sp. CcI49]|nr:hypothetical protein CcI49_30115 [Frankia sp. CcI49]
MAGLMPRRRREHGGLIDSIKFLTQFSELSRELGIGFGKCGHIGANIQSLPEQYSAALFEEFHGLLR